MIAWTAHTHAYQHFSTCFQCQLMFECILYACPNYRCDIGPVITGCLHWILWCMCVYLWENIYHLPTRSGCNQTAIKCTWKSIRRWFCPCTSLPASPLYFQLTQYQSQRNTHTHTEMRPEETFYVTAFVSGHHYISGRDEFKQQLGQRKSKTTVNLQGI